MIRILRFISWVAIIFLPASSDVNGDVIAKWDKPGYRQIYAEYDYVDNDIGATFT